MSNPTGDPTQGAYNIEDLRRIAQRRLPKGVFEFVDRAIKCEWKADMRRVKVQSRSTAPKRSAHEGEER